MKLKFRAWHKRYKKYYKVHFICLDSGVINVWAYDIIEEKDFLLHLETKQYKLEQLINIDENGNEIYQEVSL
jgi:uncharacterized Rmd1/YagE family protein